MKAFFRDKEGEGRSTAASLGERGRQAADKKVPEEDMTRYRQAATDVRAWNKPPPILTAVMRSSAESSTVHSRTRMLTLMHSTPWVGTRA